MKQHGMIRGGVRGVAAALFAVVMVGGVWLTPVAAQPAAMGGGGGGPLAQASAEAQVVLVVNNMEALSQQIASLRESLGLPLEDMNDVLGLFKRESGMINGVNDRGALLVVIEGVADAIQNDVPPEIFLLVPVEDYQEFIGNYGGAADAAGEVTAVTLPQGQDGFSKSINGFAVMGRTEQAVQGYQGSGNAERLLTLAGTLGRQYLADADVAVVVDVEALAAALRPQIEAAAAEAQAQVQMMGEAGVDASGADMAQQIFEIYAQGASAIVDSATGAVWALDFAEEGIAQTTSVHYKADSALSKVLPGGESQATQTLARLPAQPFVFAGSVDARAIDMTSLVEAVLSAFPEDQQNPIMSLYRDSLPLLEQTQSMASAFYAPVRGAMMGPGMFNTLNVYRVDQPAEFLAEYRQMLEKMNGLEVPVGGAGGVAAGAEMDADAGAEVAPGPVVTYRTSYTPNALQIEGKLVDQYQLQVEWPPEMMQQMGQLGPLMSMFGMGGYTGYLAATDEYVVMTTTPDTQLIGAALQGVEETVGIGTGGVVQQVRQDAFEKTPVAEMYLSVQGLAQTANMILPMLGGPAIEVPADVPPLAMAVMVEDQSVSLRTYVPMRTVEFVFETVSSLQGEAAMQDESYSSPSRPPY